MKTRFLKSVIKTAKSTEVEMPWTRGARRAARLARVSRCRTTPVPRKSA